MICFFETALMVMGVVFVTIGTVVVAFMACYIIRDVIEDMKARKKK